MDRRALLLVGLIAFLTCSAGFLVARDTWLARSHEALPWEFQQLVGGLGIGPTTTLHVCESSFDIRLEPNWRAAHPPLVCGEYFCPQHASSVFALRPLDLRAEGESFDAGIP